MHARVATFTVPVRLDCAVALSSDAVQKHVCAVSIGETEVMVSRYEPNIRPDLPVIVETIFAPALKRHVVESLNDMADRIRRHDGPLLSRGFAERRDGSVCFAHDEDACRWSAIGLFERVLNDRYVAENGFRYGMHFAVGQVMSHAIGLGAEALLHYRPDETNIRRVNRGIDWLTEEAPRFSNVSNLVGISVSMVEECAPERMFEPVIGERSQEWTPQDLPKAVRYVKAQSEHA